MENKYVIVNVNKGKLNKKSLAVSGSKHHLAGQSGDRDYHQLLAVPVVLPALAARKVLAGLDHAHVGIIIALTCSDTEVESSPEPWLNNFVKLLKITWGRLSSKV